MAITSLKELSYMDVTPEWIEGQWAEDRANLRDKICIVVRDLLRALRETKDTTGEYVWHVGYAGRTTIKLEAAQTDARIARRQIMALVQSWRVARQHDPEAELAERMAAPWWKSHFPQHMITPMEAAFAYLRRRGEERASDMLWREVCA